MKKVLGLDIGITSVGWSVIDLESGSILDCGVRLFEEGTAANNEKRRTTRSSRRLKSRKHNRIHDARKLLEKEGLIDSNYTLIGNPYEIRTKGLQNKLSNEEFAIAYLNLVKRRGSALETVEDDESKAVEAEKAKSVLNENDRLVKHGQFPCEIQLERLIKIGHLRGHENNFKTSNYVLELKEILKHQSFREDFNNQLINLLQRRRRFDEGPGSKDYPTPYGRFIENENGEIIEINLIEKMRGKCSVFPDELRAPKNAPTAELFNFLNDLNNITIQTTEGIEFLSSEQKKEIVDKFIRNGKHDLKPKELAKYLECDFTLLSGFRIDKSQNPMLTEFKGLKKIHSALKDENVDFLNDFSKLDKIIDILTKTKSIEERSKLINALSLDLSAQQISKLSNISGISNYHSLSIKAIDLMLNDLFETNDNQMQILSKKGLLKTSQDKYKGYKNIPLDNELILSPVARKALRESFKVVNAVRKNYGELDSIIVEMPRDKNSDEERSRITKAQKAFELENQKIKDMVGGKKANDKSFMKLKLYQQQEGKSIYSGKPIDLDLMLNDPYAYEIDHIIPISISFDDSQSNKVLVSHADNQIKNNRTPYQVFNAEGFKNGWSWQEYYSFCFNLLKTNGKQFNKKFQYLIFDQDITKFDVMKQFISRNLVDTSYASRSVLNTLQDYFKANKIETKIISIRGAVTNAFRKRMELEKDRDENFYHHAVDASIVAMLSEKAILNKILYSGKIKEDLYNVDSFDYVVESDEEYFNDKFFKLLSHVKYVGENDGNPLHSGKYLTPKISHKVDRKPNRQISDETIYSTRSFEGEDWVIKKYKDIYDPKFLTLAQIIDGQKGNVENLLIYRNDRKTFDKLVTIVEDYKKSVGKIEKENPFYWYKEIQKHGYITKYAKNNDGAPIISIKYTDGKLGNHIDISSKYQTKEKKVVLLQISPYRTDIYKNEEGKYSFVTIRYNDIHYSDLKKKYVIDKMNYQNKLIAKEMDNEYSYQFSLYRNDVFKLDTKMKDGTVESNLWRFVATNNDITNKLEIRPTIRHKYFDASNSKEVIQKMITIGNNIVNLTKYNVDVLGNMYKIDKEDLIFEFE